MVCRSKGARCSTNLLIEVSKFLLIAGISNVSASKKQEGSSICARSFTNRRCIGGGIGIDKVERESPPFTRVIVVERSVEWIFCSKQRVKCVRRDGDGIIGRVRNAGFAREARKRKT